MATLQEQIAARDDEDLKNRMVAAAERQHIPQPKQWVEENMGRLVSTPIGDTTISDVHAYAVATYNPPPRPGANPAAVTDPQILDAVSSAFNPTGA